MGSNTLVDAEKLIRKLEELGFSYHQETKKSRCYRRKADSAHAFVPKRAHLPETFVAQVLHNAGCTHQQIREFIAACNA